jgi:hypothetical protein
MYGKVMKRQEWLVDYIIFIFLLDFSLSLNIIDLASKLRLRDVAYEKKDEENYMIERILQDLFGGQTTPKLGIVLPHLSVEMSIELKAPPTIREDKQWEEEVAYFYKAIADAQERFGKIAKQAVKRTVRERNISLIVRLAGERLSSRELLALCTSELALAVEVHRRRATCHELQRIQAAAKAAGDKKLKRQANAAAKKAAKAWFSGADKFSVPHSKAIFGWPFL